MKRSVRAIRKEYLLVFTMSILSFSLHAQQLSVDHNRLTWAADPATDDQFIVQRHVAGKEYTDIALVWTGEGFYSYQFTDKSFVGLSTGYRLKRISTTRVVTYTTTENIQGLKSFPNPLHNHLVVSAPDEWISKEVNVTLLRADGTIAMQIKMKGEKQMTLNMERLQPGNYLLQLDCERGSRRQWVQKSSN
jgi:hypothetical protein